MDRALSHRRQSMQAKRQLRMALAIARAAEAIGPVTKGMETFALTAGAFSLIDAITHVLDVTGPADVVLSTWTAAGADLNFAYALMRDGRIRSLRFIVDFSFPSRQPAYCAALRQTFGDDCVRTTKSHAKFCTITNDAWSVVVRTSMNLNENRRMESLEITEDPAFARFLLDYTDSLFDFQEPGALDKRPIDIIRDFEHFANSDQPAPAEEELIGSTDARKFYSNEPFGNDLRRAGLSYLGGKK